VITAEARQRISAHVTRAETAGAEIVTDGRGVVVENHDGGYFLGPCLLDRVTPDMEVYTDEVFGPVLVVLRVADLDAAVELVNSSAFGNGVALFTSSGAVARRFQREVDIGMVGINVPIPVPMAFHSFGGRKSSLFGDMHVHGPEGVRFYTRAKTITSRWPDTGFPAARPDMNFPTAT
jgi:malonate-semialdehyde dehydrogenase (acetylating)/methylmalonate-semialdehyde dehydrogenase